MEAPPGFEPGMEVLQTSALPLGDGALKVELNDLRKEIMERETGFEPATSTLARSHSTTELLPHTPRSPQITNDKRNIWVQTPTRNTAHVLKNRQLPIQ